MKQKYNPTQSLNQFILGIYAYWRDKGVSVLSSKRRMFSSTYEALDKIDTDDDMRINYEENVKYMDHLVKRLGSKVSKKYEGRIDDISEEDYALMKELQSIKENLSPIIERIKKQVS